MLKAIAIGLEAIALRMEAIAMRLEAIAIRWEAIAARVEAIATRVEAIATSNKKLLVRHMDMSKTDFPGHTTSDWHCRLAGTTNNSSKPQSVRPRKLPTICCCALHFWIRAPRFAVVQN